VTLQVLLKRQPRNLNNVNVASATVCVSLIASQSQTDLLRLHRTSSCDMSQDLWLDVQKFDAMTYSPLGLFTKTTGQSHNGRTDAELCRYGPQPSTSRMHVKLPATQCTHQAKSLVANVVWRMQDRAAIVCMPAVCGSLKQVA
jgi:hypothetical protein